MSYDGLFDVPTPPDADATDPGLMAVQERLSEVGAAWRARPLPLAPLLRQLHTLAADGRPNHPPIALQEEMTFMSASSVTIPVATPRRRWIIIPVAATLLLVALSIGFFAFFAHRATTAPIAFTSSTVVATPIVTNAQGFQRFSTGSYEADTLITGPDGNIWFAGERQDATLVHQAVVGRMTTTGNLTIFPIPNTLFRDSSKLQHNYFCEYLTLGSDGALWFNLQTIQNTPSGTTADFSRIVRVTTNGQVMLFTPPPIAAGRPTPRVEGLTAGPDGALWFNVDDTFFSNKSVPDMYRVGSITTSGTFTYHALPPQLHTVYITAGPDGALWFSTYKAIERMTLQGTLTTYPVTGYPTDLRFTPDGVLWFEVYGTGKTPTTYLGRFDRVHHTITYISVPTIPAMNAVLPLGVGPDGHIWFTQQYLFTHTQNLRRLFTVSSAGTLSEVVLPKGNISGWVTAGPDGNLWFDDFVQAAKGAYDNYIARITLAGS